MTKIAEALISTLARSTVAELLADTGFGYTPGSSQYVKAGDRIRVVDEMFAYSVASSGATDHDLTTAGGVKLYVIPGNRGWDIKAFGAGISAATDSEAITKALTRLVNALGGSLVASPGRYYLNSLVDVTWPTTGFPVRMVTIDFEGAVFEVPATNTAGGIKITTRNNFQQMRIRNIEMQSAAPIGTHGSPTNGIGLHIYSALRPGSPGFGTTASKQVALQNVNIVAKAPAQTGRWDSGIRIDGFWFPELVNCWTVTRHPDTDVTALNYEVGAGIEILNSYSPLLVNCYSSGRFTHNILLDENEDMNYEDFQITACYAVGAKSALTVKMSSTSLINAASKEPGGRVSGGHYNGHQYAINIENRRQVTVDGPNLYTTTIPGSINYADGAFIRLHNCQDVDAMVQCPEGGHYVNDNDCTSLVLISGVSDGVRVQNSKLGAKGIGIKHTATGTKNVAEGNDYRAFSLPAAPGPTKAILDTSGTLRGGDVVVTATPEIQFGGASVGVTYSTRDAGWTRQGRHVSFWAQVDLTSKGTSTGDASLVIPGLPAAVTGSDFGISISYGTGATSAPMGGRISASGGVELFRDGASGNRSIRVSDADIANTSTIRISGTYLAQL